MGLKRGGDTAEARRVALDEARAAHAASKVAATRPRPPHLALAPDPAEGRVPLHARDLPRPDPLPTRAQLAGAVLYRAHEARVHARNLPRYTARVLAWAWAGRGKAWAWWWHLATAPEHRALYRTAAKAGQDRAMRDAHHHHARRCLALAALAAAVALSPLAGLVAMAGARLGTALYLGLVTWVLAAVGRRPDETLAEVAVTPTAGPYVSSERIAQALSHAGFPGAVTLGGPRREGSGATKRLAFTVELPQDGKGHATAVLAARETIAARLQRELPCLHLTRGAHAGQVHLTLFDQDPMVGDPVPSPLLSLTEWCLWDPVPWGFDIRGATVNLPLLWTSLLVGAKPRMGKTFAIRTLVLAACMDRHARVYLWDGKGAGDYRAFQPLCAVWGQGHSASRGQPKACLEMLRQVAALVTDRNERIDRLPVHLRPEGKLTREVSRDPRYDLPLILVVVDEVQRLVADPVSGAAIRDELIALAQNAPSCGVIVIVGAQRPTQTTGQGSLGDLPPALGSRAAFKTMDAGESNVILGNGHASAGFDSSDFPDEYEGVCYLRSGAEVAEGPKGVQQVKTFYVNDTQLAAKCAALAEARGSAAGVTVVLEKAPEGDARGRLAAVFEPGEDRLTIAATAERMGASTSDVWALTREAGVEVKKIRAGGVGTEWGFYRAALD